MTCPLPASAACPSVAACLALVVAEVSRLGLRVQSPDYLATRFYAPQWARAGRFAFYRLPASRGGRILAVVEEPSSAGPGGAWFDAAGLARPEWSWMA